MSNQNKTIENIVEENKRLREEIKDLKALLRRYQTERMMMMN
jgi:hypothetical protein